MDFMRRHWFDVGLVLAVLAGGLALFGDRDPLSLVLWVSLGSLFLHQFEEYRFPGTFPGLMNTTIFASAHPERYPLNANTALIVNVAVGWVAYGLAAVLGRRALWLGIATILVSVGNVLAHVIFFNIKGRTLYNPGMVTALLLFAPVTVAFGKLVIGGHLATPADWIVGVVLGIGLTFLGIFKMIDWLKDEDSPYVFPARSMMRGGQ